MLSPPKKIRKRFFQSIDLAQIKQQSNQQFQQGLKDIEKILEKINKQKLELSGDPKQRRKSIFVDRTNKLRELQSTSNSSKQKTRQSFSNGKSRRNSIFGERTNKQMEPDLALYVYKQILQRKKEKIEMPKFIQCPICALKVLRQKIIPFCENCTHFSCNICLEQHIKQKLLSYKIIQCLDQTCTQSVTEDSKIYRSIMSLQQKEKYYKILIYYAVNKTENQKLCPKEECPGYMLIDQIPIRCIVCNQEFCLKCMFNQHTGPCDQNGINFLEKDLFFKKCDKCKMIVEKNEGCDHMTCRCGHQFCYICGIKWEKQHNCGSPQIVQQDIIQLVP